MENTEDNNGDNIENNCPSCEEKKKGSVGSRRKEFGLSCMLNTEVGAVLAVIRRPSGLNLQFVSSPEENLDSSVQQSLKSLRSIIFNPQQEWQSMDPSIYLSPFLDVLQSEDVPAAATGVALSNVLKIINLQLFNEKTPGAKPKMNSIVAAITACRLDKTDPVSEDAAFCSGFDQFRHRIKRRFNREASEASEDGPRRPISPSDSLWNLFESARLVDDLRYITESLSLS